MRVGIVGAGLAGLSCGIQLLLDGSEVHIFDKQRIPALKVCGEYLSLEVLPLIERLGIRLDVQNFPFIDRLTAIRGQSSLDKQLALGGVGISRQSLDGAFKLRFLELGGTLTEGATVQAIKPQSITLRGQAEQHFDLVINASGRLNPFREEDKPKGDAYVGYKKHVPAGSWAKDRIHLEFYPWGYIGYNLVEDNQLCICSLFRQDRLKALKSLEAHEAELTFSEPGMERQFHYPAKRVAISNFHFYIYQPSQIPAVGDAAGNIPPLVGNGMSLAILSGHTMAMNVSGQGEAIGENARIQAGLFLNNLALSPLAPLGIHALDLDPLITQNIVGFTHGRPF